ncbi:hypothetical protein V6N13_106059 [Hibiscus sabdariffa]
MRATSSWIRDDRQGKKLGSNSDKGLSKEHPVSIKAIEPNAMDGVANVGKQMSSMTDSASQVVVRVTVGHTCYPIGVGGDSVSDEGLHKAEQISANPGGPGNWGTQGFGLIEGDDLHKLVFFPMSITGASPLINNMEVLTTRILSS